MYVIKRVNDQPYPNALSTEPNAAIVGFWSDANIKKVQEADTEMSQKQTMMQ
jgi:hypothetical protein